MIIEFVIKADDQASVPINDVNKALGGLGGTSGGAQSAFAGIAGGLANIAQYAIGGLLTQGINNVTGAIRDLASEAINSLASFEQYEVQFGVLLGSADAAKQRMEELAEFGMTTPFELPQVVEADRVLQNFGFHAVDAKDRFGFAGEEILRIAGDVASGTGANFTDISNLLGRFSSGSVGEAIMRMQELGITTKTQLTEMGLAFDSQGSLILGTGEKTAAWTKEALKAQEALPGLNDKLEIAKQRLAEMQAKSTTSASALMAQEDRVKDLENTIAEANETIKTGWVESQGAPTLDQATSILLDIMKDKYGGMMEEQSLTFEGMLSNLSDWKDATLRQIGSPIFELLKDKLKVVLDFLGGPEAKAAINTFASGLAAFMASDVVPFIEQLIASIPTLVSWFEALSNKVQGMADFAAKFGLDKLFITFEDGSSKMASLLQMFGLTESQAQGLGSAINAVANFVIGLVNTIGPTVQQIIEFITQNVSLQDVLTGLGILLASVVIPALGSLIAAAAPVIGMVIGVIAAVSLLRNAWESDFLGIRTALTEFWVNTAQPALTQLGQWLQVNIPIAIQTLKTFWDTQLMPALQTLWTILSTVVFPVLKQLVDTYFAQAQTSVKQTAGFFETTLFPAIQKVSNFISTTVMPIISALANVFDAVLGLAIRVVGGYIENVLKPGFERLVEIVKTNVLPVFNEIARITRDVLGPPLQWLYDVLIKPLVAGFDAMGINVQSITRALNDFANGINNITLPDWLEPGSPTPFEMGLRGIQDAMQSLSTIGGPALAGALPEGGSMAMGGAGNRVTIGQIVFNGQSAPANPEQAQQSASLFVDALRARGVDIGGAS